MVTNTTRSSQPQQTLMDTNIKPQVAKECFDQHPRKIVDHGPIDRQRTLVNSNNYNLTPLQYWTPDQVETWLSNSRFKQLLPFLSGLNGSDLTHLNLKSLKSFGVESVITRVELLNDILLVKKQTSGNLARVDDVNTYRKVSNGSYDGIYTPLNVSPYLHLKDLSEYPVDHSKVDSS